jgi:hypothetical protein
VTDAERRLVVEKWAEVLHLIWVAVPYLSWQAGGEVRVAALVDVAATAVRVMLRPTAGPHRALRDRLAAAHDDEASVERQAVRILDLGDDEFVRQYRGAPA